jgi:hypothetical protein
LPRRELTMIADRWLDAYYGKESDATAHAAG